MNSTETIVSQTPRLFQAIGRSVVRFQQVEQWLAEELAMLLRMREREDQHLVSAAMSFKQKVDLLVELYPKRRNSKLPEVNITAVRKALYAAEEYRNRVVHSFWAIECGDQSRWLRIKGSLKGRKGFSLNSVAADIEALERCNEALKTICEWILCTPEQLNTATEVLISSLQERSNSTATGEEYVG